MGEFALHPRPSRTLSVYLLGLHGVAMLAVIHLPLAPSVLSMLIIALLLHGAWLGWSAVLRRAPWSIVALSWNAGGWMLTRADGQMRTACLLPSSVVTHFVVVLHFRDPARRRYVLPLWRDSVAAEDWRRLQVRLRLHGARTGQT